MNENIDLTKILKDCPRGFKLYSLVHGEVEFGDIDNKNRISTWINVIDDRNICISFTPEGKYSIIHDGECILFPSKEQRDWSKFTAPWYKKKKRFNPKTLKPFDKILVERYDNIWVATLLSYYNGTIFITINNGLYESCIPYNEDTKHLVGTNEEVPEYYRYWED